MSAKTIIPNQKFKHDGQVYEEGEKYEIESELAYYFKMCGWTGERQPASDQAATLKIDDGEHGHAAEVE